MTAWRSLAAICALLAAFVFIDRVSYDRWVARENVRELDAARLALSRCIARLELAPSPTAANVCVGVADGVSHQLAQVSVERHRRAALLRDLERVRTALADGRGPSPDDITQLDSDFAAATRDLHR